MRFVKFYMEKKNKHYFYVLKCSDDSFYGGYTTDLQRRLSEHNDGSGEKYTRARRPVKLLHYEQYKTRSDAMKAEYAFKQLNRSKKEQFLKEAEKDDAPTKKFYE